MASMTACACESALYDHYAAGREDLLEAIAAMAAP